MSVLNDFLKNVFGSFLEKGAHAGLKKISELRGHRGEQIKAAVLVAEEFVSDLRRAAFGFARSRCSVGLREELGRDGLHRFIADLDLGPASWKLQTVDDSSEHNRWGSLSHVTVSGVLVGVQVRGQAGSSDLPFEVVLVKEGDEWKVGRVSC